MKESEVRDMARSGVYSDEVLNGKVEETHISWVILTRKYAIKIKKPIRLTFLDFSTLDLRRALCEKELRLNSRFSDIYLAVLPIRFVDGTWTIGGDSSLDAIDYCVVMKRMSTQKRLDNVLRNGTPAEKSIRALGITISVFHNKAEKQFAPFDIEAARNTFNDIATMADFAKENVGTQFGEIIQRAIGWSDNFLQEYRDVFQRRIDHGLKRDVHGDLHAGNIFLYSKPVLFDCIEFNDQYRHIDVLYEIAFLCMDLERFHHKHLSDILLTEYRSHFPAFQQREDYHLLQYFKCLRSNIRAKVHVMKAQQAENESELSDAVLETKKYLILMNRYMADLHALAHHKPVL